MRINSKLLSFARTSPSTRVFLHEADGITLVPALSSCHSQAEGLRIALLSCVCSTEAALSSSLLLGPPLTLFTLGRSSPASYLFIYRHFRLHFSGIASRGRIFSFPQLHSSRALRDNGEHNKKVIIRWPWRTVLLSFRFDSEAGGARMRTTRPGGRAKDESWTLWNLLAYFLVQTLMLQFMLLYQRSGVPEGWRETISSQRNSGTRRFNWS